MDVINVAEIFGPTIQGEGPKAGIKTIFVRVVGCDFNCSWCDSKFAWKENEHSKKYTSAELVGELYELCRKTNTSNVVLTGGNPCLYDFTQVIIVLKAEGISVDVETQGSKLPDWIKLCDTLVISPKAPSSNQPDVLDNIENWLKENYFNLSSKLKIAIKIPIFNNEDFQFAKNYYERIISKINLDIRLYLSVGNDDTEEAGNISNRILERYEQLIEQTMHSDLENVYVLPQLHTLVWGNRQGV